MPIVDLLTGFITVRKTKNLQGRTVPANSIARAAFVDLGSRRHHPNDADEWVFDPRPTHAAFFPKAVERAMTALREAGKDTSMLVGFTWHGCRHSWASNLTMAGVDPRTLQVLDGWKTLAMVQPLAKCLAEAPEYQSLRMDPPRSRTSRMAAVCRAVAGTESHLLELGGDGEASQLRRVPERQGHPRCAEGLGLVVNLVNTEPDLKERTTGILAALCEAG